METVMLYPARGSEKAISGYSETLVNSIGMDSITYTAGKPLTLFKQKILGHDVVHVQHEYNLLGWYGVPFFALYFVLFFSRAKVVTTMHTVLSQKEKFKGSILKTFLRKILYSAQNRVINWCSSKVVVHAEFFKEILIAEYGFSEDKIQIIPQGIIEDVNIISKDEAKKINPL